MAHAPGPGGFIGCASSRNIGIVVVFPRFGAFMRRNLGLCQLVRLRRTVVKSSPKLGEVPEGRRSVCALHGGIFAAWHTPPALRATFPSFARLPVAFPSTLEGELSTKLKGKIATAQCV